MTARRWFLVIGLGLWIGLLAWWWLRPDPPRGDWLGYAVALLPLMLVYELSQMALHSMRRRRERRDE